MGNKPVSQKQLTLNVGTLNYSGIIKSPLEFYSSDGDSPLQAQVSEIFQTLEQENNLVWEFGKVDVLWQVDRYSPLYLEDCGVKNKLYMMTRAQFLAQWDDRKDKIYKNLKRKYPNDKIEGFDQHLTNMRTFDLTAYESILIFHYTEYNDPNSVNTFKERFNSGVNFMYPSQKYRKSQKSLFSKSYLQEHKKVNLTIKAIEKFKIDILFVQEADEFMVREIEKKMADMLIVKNVDFYDHTITNCTSVIFIRDRPEFDIRSLHEENSLFQKNYNKLNLKKTQQKKLSKEDILGLDLNDETIVQAIGNIILLCPHLTSKSKKNGEQLVELGEKLRLLKEKWFPHCHLIVGGDLNGNFLDLNKNFVDSKTYHVFPRETITTSKRRTHLQAQKNKANKNIQDIKDYLISTLPMSQCKVMTISGREITQKKGEENHHNDTFLIPTDEHPYDHFLVAGKVKVPLPILKTYHAAFKKKYTPEELTYKEILQLKDDRDEQEAEEKAENKSSEDITDEQLKNQNMMMIEQIE